MKVTKVEPIIDENTPKKVQNSLGWTVPSVVKLLKVRSNQVITCTPLLQSYSIYAAIAGQKYYRVELATWHCPIFP